MKYAGIAICLAIIFGAVTNIGIHLYNDFMSMTFVLGGAVGFALLKNETSEMPRNFGDGAVYFGWLGLLIGLVAIAGNAFGAWGSVEKMGPALAVSMLPLVYGYTVRLICMAVGSAKTAK
jgi:hypothetical protein